MGREWKPGDVARDGDDTFFRVDWGWVDEGGSANVPVKPRPLVVIDPEDREQIERLDGVYQDVLDNAPQYHGLTDVMQAALRSLVSPPRPVEPTGLGAVVEAIYDNQFVHVGGGKWRRVGKYDDLCDYADIAVVKVLSGGVTK